MAWYAKTKFYHIVNLTAWQRHPNMDTYTNIHLMYRPSALQMRSQYPFVIDWIPFTSIRDRLIQMHSANPEIDQLFCELVSAYAIETDLSVLVAGASPLRAYIRVTDLTTAMGPVPPANDADSACSIPAPSVGALFSDSSYAWAVFQFLHIDHDIGHYKIDPAFFGKYPELYDAGHDIMASGVPLKPAMQLSLTRPRPLDACTFDTYQSFISYSS